MVLGGLHGTGQSTVIGSLFVQAPTAGVVPVVHAIAAGQPVAPGVVFVGRQEETERLLAGLAPGEDAGPVVVSAVAGMGGVGKTALARFCAAEAVARDWFPGGAYVVDLQGYSPGGLVVNTSLFAPLLHQFGVAAENVPGDPAAQAAVYDQALRVLAAQGRRVLLVLDNASTAAQLDGLLPTAGDHRVVITTRDTLAVPGARRLDLDVLTEADALDLLDEALREADPTDGRAADGAAGLVKVCGLLPLAVRIAAGLLADEPDMSCAELAEELASTTTDGFTHGETKVAPVLAASIDRLTGRDPQAAQLLSLLPLNPGPDISTEAAAALGGASVAAARTSLRTLRQAHLISLVEHRWRLHDLVRRYLLDRLGAQDAAAARLLDHYVTTAEAADTHVRALRGQQVPDLFRGRAQALAWFDAEHANLVAAAQWAAVTKYAKFTFRLASALATYQARRRHLSDWLHVSQTALKLSQRSSDPLVKGVAWNNLGLVLRELRRDEAITAHERALDIFKQLGDRHRESMALSNLGAVLAILGRLEEAVPAQEHALEIFQETGDRHSEAATWNNLGSTLKKLGRFDESITAHENARRINQEIGNLHGEGTAWGNVAVSLERLGRLEEAVTAHERARDIFQETGDRPSEAMAWNNLGISLRKLRRAAEAITAYKHARDIFHETGDHQREGPAWLGLALALRLSQRTEEARRSIDEAVAAYTKSGDADTARRLRHILNALEADEDSTGS